MCNLKSPHVQERHAMGKELPPIAEDIGRSHHSHMPTPQGRQDADNKVSWLRSVYQNCLKKLFVGSLFICPLQVTNVRVTMTGGLVYISLTSSTSAARREH
jgi:hypothetical protein